MSEENKAPENNNVTELKPKAAAEGEATMVEKSAAEKAPPEMFPEMAKELEMTEEEEKEAPASAGVRGQLKKLMRTFKDEISRTVHGMNDGYSHTVDMLQKSMSNFQQSVVEKLGQLDKKFTQMYGGLVREVMIPLEGRLVIVDTGTKALLDYVADKLFTTYQSHHQFAGELIELRNAVKALQTQVETLKGEKPVDRVPEVHPEISQNREEYIKGFRSDVEKLRGQIETALREAARERMKAVAEGSAPKPAEPTPAPEAAQPEAKKEETSNGNKQEEAVKDESGSQEEKQPEKEEVK